LDFVFAEKTLLNVCLTYIRTESNRSRIACFSLIPDPERIWIQKLKNRIGSRQGCQIGFFDAKFHKFGFFLEVVGVKKIVWLYGFFSSIFGFFGGCSHVLSDWCLAFLKIFLQVLLAFVRECFVHLLKLYLATDISHTQDSFNSVVVIVVNVRICCLVLVQHKLGLPYLVRHNSWRIYVSHLGQFLQRKHTYYGMKTTFPEAWTFCLRLVSKFRLAIFNGKNYKFNL